MMDLASLLSVRWDAPYRFLASVVGLAAVFSWDGRGAFMTLSEGAAQLSWEWIAVPLGYSDAWITTHLSGGGPILLILTAAVAGLACTPSFVLAKSRASATVWLLAAIATYFWSPWLVLLAVIVGITVRATHAYYRSDDKPQFFERWAHGAMHVAAGLLWAALVVLTWPVATPPTRTEELRAALRA